jgi:2-phosphoglycerate kinase
MVNPENKALDRTYFIGGPPRVGKTILALVLAKKVEGHFVSTDSIRNAAKKACNDKNNDLFIINKTENISEKEWMSNHVDKPEISIDYQNRESKAVWPSLVSFCNTFCEDDAIHIVEGVALLPSLVSQMNNRPQHVVYVGNTNLNHAKSMVEYAKNFPERDWMGARNYSDDKINAMAHFVRAMSLYFKSEAEKYGFSYYEIDDINFQGSIEKICDDIIHK